MTAAVKKIIRSMDEHPEQWEFGWGDYTIDHKSGLQLWIASGFWFYRVRRPYELGFDVFDKVRVDLALCRLKAAKKRKDPTLDDCAALLDRVEV